MIFHEYLEKHETHVVWMERHNEAYFVKFRGDQLLAAADVLVQWAFNCQLSLTYREAQRIIKRMREAIKEHSA